MTDSNKKVSILAPYQLPAFIREDSDYIVFQLFIQAYYKWMENPGNLIDGSKDLLNNMDIDQASDQFLSFFARDFLPFLPQNGLVDKATLIKLSKELYQSKGTTDSYKLFFRALYNSDVDFFYTKDAVLRASAGIWYVPRSLKLSSLDLNFLATNNLRVYGETTKSIATIETCIIAETKIEMFISDIERLFNSGEFVRVVDTNNQDVYFLNNQIVDKTFPESYVLRAKIVGQISQIKIDPLYRGLTYFTGDPVIVYGGLNSLSGHGASAVVGNTTSGSIQRINVITPGYGYTSSTDLGFPGNSNTSIVFSNLNSGAKSPIAIVGGLNTSQPANATFIPIDYIGLKTSSSSYTGVLIGANNYGFANIAVSNANTTLINAFSFTAFTTYPLSSVLVENGGGGLQTIPTITPLSLYNSEADLTQGNLAGLGILAPIVIVSGGKHYAANDKIVFTGGSGTGAYANVSTVDANGSILSINYVYGDKSHLVPLGGMAYELSLPTLSVTSSNGANAVLVVTNTLGTGATLSPTTDRIGSITTINIQDNGEDYISAPNVSFRVEDILVTNISPANLPSYGDIVYQGLSQSNSSYLATVASITNVVPDTTSNGVYSLRVFEYNTLPNVALPIKVVNKTILMNITSSFVPATWQMDSRYQANVTPYLLVYGDGTAQGVVTFLNGLVIGSGQYLSTTGQPSSFDVLQSQDYNNYTYELTTDVAISQYRDTLLNLLHPTGMKVLGRVAMRSNNALDTAIISEADTAVLLQDIAWANSYVTISASFTNQSNNIVYFNNLGPGANLANLIATNSVIEIISNTGDYVYSQINSINYIANTITLTDNVWLTFANVAYVTANANSNTININSLTGSYNIINGGVYTTAFPLQDIVKANQDLVSVANNSPVGVIAVNVVQNTITTKTNLTNSTNSLMSVSRTITANANNVRIYTSTGTPYLARITTENGTLLLTDPDGNILII